MAIAALRAFLLGFVLFMLSSLPLHFSVKLLGGKTSILKTMLVVFVSGIIVTAIQNYVQLIGGLIAFLVLIWIYHEIFRLKWFKAFAAWLLQFVFIVIIYLLAAIFLVSLIGISFVI